MPICLGVEGMRNFDGSKPVVSRHKAKSDHPLFKYIDVTLEQILKFLTHSLFGMF